MVAKLLPVKTVMWIDPHVHKTQTSLGQQLIQANCTADYFADSGGVGCAPGDSGGAKKNCGYSALDLERCQEVWDAHVGATFLDIGVAGFKLDQDDGDSHGGSCVHGTLARDPVICYDSLL
jgi:alpha-glucosidase (family GH31 glycosyl hydrolase)